MHRRWWRRSLEDCLCRILMSLRCFLLGPPCDCFIFESFFFSHTHVQLSFIFSSQHLQTPMPMRFYKSMFGYISYSVRYMMWERRGMLVLRSVPPSVRKFQMDQASVGAGINPTRRPVSKKVVQWSNSCTRSQASTASAHHNFIFLCFSFGVRDCLGCLDGQSVRDGLAAVEISRSSFQRFFFLSLNQYYLAWITSFEDFCYF